MISVVNRSLLTRSNLPNIRREIWRRAISAENLKVFLFVVFYSHYVTYD